MPLINILKVQAQNNFRLSTTLLAFPSLLSIDFGSVSFTVTLIPECILDFPPDFLSISSILLTSSENIDCVISTQTSMTSRFSTLSTIIL